MYKTIRILTVFFVMFFFATGAFAWGYKHDLGSIKKHSQKRVKIIQKKLDKLQKAHEEALEKARKKEEEEKHRASLAKQETDEAEDESAASD